MILINSIIVLLLTPGWGTLHFHIHNPFYEKVGSYRIKKSDKDKIHNLKDLTMVIDLSETGKPAPIVDLDFVHTNGSKYHSIAGSVRRMRVSTAETSHAAADSVFERLNKVSRVFASDSSECRVGNTVIYPEKDVSIILGFSKRNARSKVYTRSDFLFVTMEPTQIEKEPDTPPVTQGARVDPQPSTIGKRRADPVPAMEVPQKAARVEWWQRESWDRSAAPQAAPTDGSGAGGYPTKYGKIYHVEPRVYTIQKSIRRIRPPIWGSRISRWRVETAN
ncbi:hypothetical protein FOZ63_011482 [Perkinsus olseni]|uniref:Uncharacterized protein n=1 Tax=Perkinsus olseni TaxID=32597 RepID=A0A7J6NG12_PEROL|nr:hypothetical protein FOZ60_010113 [Perkinsus olseni]KAF4727111.1 hypothetical protein FOZ63_011482 [Perkinsus olseni]